MKEETEELTDGEGFADARACKEWLGGLPLTNLPQALASLLEGAKRLNASEALAGMERMKCLELAREKAVLLLGELRAKNQGRAMPLSPTDHNLWLLARSLLDEMEAGYRKAHEESAGDGELQRLSALISQRMARCHVAQIMLHAGVYRRFDAARWGRLHQIYRRAQEAGLQDERVKDSLESDDGASSVAEAYAQALLLESASLEEKSFAEINYVEALARLWSRKVKVGTEAVEGAALAVDLGGEAPPAAVAQVPEGPWRRYVDASSAALSVRKRVHALKKEEPFEKLGLPEASDDIDLLHLLQSLQRAWGEGVTPRVPTPVEGARKASLVFGLPDIHFFLSAGKPFEQPDKKRELTPREKQDIEIFGRVREQTQSQMTAQAFSVDSWQVVGELPGALRLQRPTSSSRSVAWGRLVAVRSGDTAPFFLGMVSALEQEAEGRMLVTVTLFPGKPETVPVRAADARNRANAKWSEGFSLPAMEKLKVPESLVVPRNIAQRGRGIDRWVGGEAKESTVYEIVERGADFDRITIF
jgi:hypothetical protein